MPPLTSPEKSSTSPDSLHGGARNGKKSGPWRITWHGIGVVEDSAPHTWRETGTVEDSGPMHGMESASWRICPTAWHGIGIVEDLPDRMARNGDRGGFGFAHAVVTPTIGTLPFRFPRMARNGDRGGFPVSRAARNGIVEGSEDAVCMKPDPWRIPQQLIEMKLELWVLCSRFVPGAPPSPFLTKSSTHFQCESFAANLESKANNKNLT